MAYRFTNTDKWNDSWFYELDLRQKAVFLYLCDLCDIAGFYEINFKRMAQDIGMSDADVKGALKGLYSRIIYSGDGKYLFLRNFVKHQKNFPLNEKNPAHRGIIKLLEEKLQTFNLQTINDYFQSPMQGASMGLQSPIGKGKGNGKGNNFSLVLSFLEEGFKTPFSEWLEYKKSRKESYKTQKSLEACYRKLKDLSGNDPVTAGKIVEQSLANNWAGLFELKGNKSGSGKYENLKNKYQKK